jgi:outer membrane protein assembly factor BamB
MQREFTFYPEIERARDLLYSEYTSQDRSIHVLLQDNSTSRHHFLLSVYRDIVSRYLSSSRIQPPGAFLLETAVRMDELSGEARVTADDLPTMGLYVLLRGPDGGHLLASKDSDVFVHSAGETLSLSDMPAPAVTRLSLGGRRQGELFPHRLKDAMLLFQFDADGFRGRDLVLGCDEQDRGTVVTALSDRLWLASPNRRNSLTSEFLTRRVLVVRIDELPAVAPRPRSERFGARRPMRWAVAWGGAAAVLGIAIVAWQTLMPEQRGRAAQERAPQTEASAAAGENKARSEPAATNVPPRLAESWQRTFGDAVTSSPVSHDDLVIFGCRDGNVYALDRESGKTRWTVPLGGGIGASPVLHDNGVVLADYNGTVVSVAGDDGSVRWRQKLPQRVVSSAAVSNDRVVLGCYDGRAYCLSLADGKMLWTRATNGIIRASTAASSGRFFVASYDGHLYALSSATGEVNWRYRLSGSVSSSPFAYEDMVVVGSPDGSLHAVDAERGVVRWKFATRGAIKSSPVVAGNFVYTGSNDKSVYCLNVADGTMVWRYQTTDLVLGRPAVRDGVVYVGSYDGYLYCLHAGTGELLDRYKSDGEIYSSPWVDANGIYFGTNNGHFVALSFHSRKAL